MLWRYLRSEWKRSIHMERRRRWRKGLVFGRWSSQAGTGSPAALVWISDFVLRFTFFVFEKHGTSIQEFIKIPFTSFLWFSSTTYIVIIIEIRSTALHIALASFLALPFMGSASPHKLDALVKPWRVSKDDPRSTTPEQPRAVPTGRVKLLRRRP